MIEMYLLKQLAGLSEYSTLAEAAEHLYITQPTLTRSIRKLERLLGVELFRREKNRIYINDNGRLAVEYAIRILNMENEMIQAVQAIDRSHRTIAIGSCAPAPNLMLKPELQRIYPEMQITSEIRNETELLKGLKRGEFQIVILANEVTENGLCCKKIGTEHLRLSVLSAHPAAAMKSVTFSDINSGSYIVYRNLGVWGDIVRQYMPDVKFIMQNEMDEYAEVVNTSSLPTFDTDLAVAIYGQNVNRIGIPIRDEAAKMTFYAVYRETDKQRFDGLLKRISENIDS